jgi:hypothetical protein
MMSSGRSPIKREGVEDVLWVLLNPCEQLFNH